MVTASEKARQNRAYQRLFHESYKRLKRRGLDEQRAGTIAREVAERSLKRLETPDYHTEMEFSEAVGRVCGRLSEGLSSYALIAEMPYLATARIDRVVGVATRTNPPVDLHIALAAKRAIRLDKLSGSLALLFTGLALGTLGLWYAIGVGFVLSILGEIYFQALMPPVVRKTIADMRVPAVINAAAAAAIVYFLYRWIVDSYPRALLIVVAIAAFMLILFVLPAATLACLVRRRERTRRKDLERKLSAE